MQRSDEFHTINRWYLMNERRKVVTSGSLSARVAAIVIFFVFNFTMSALNLWKCLEKRSDGRLKFHHSTHLVNAVKQVSSKVPRYQNSYRLEPENPLKIDPVDKIVRSVMINRLEDASYDPNESPKLCAQVASEIRKKILKLDYERHKLVVVVTIIEKASQSLETSMGFIWDADRDNYSTYSFETQTFFAYCALVAAYYE